MSNRGGPISLAAPGEDILTTARGARYVGMYGNVGRRAAGVRSACAPDRGTASCDDRPGARGAAGGAQRLSALAGKVRAGLLDVGRAMARLLAQPRLGA